MDLHGNNDNEHMNGKAFLGFLQKTAIYLIDLIPPYHTIEGSLQGKKADTDGLFYLIVEDEVVEVDPSTYETLKEGEAVRIRHTRRKRAISIERLSSDAEVG